MGAEGTIPPPGGGLDNQFDYLSDDALEDKLANLAANLNAANCQHILMIAEFDRRRAWAHEGTRSCAHWLNWRCSISLSAAREKLRVGHALAYLTQTKAAFASGKLSFSKARAITRVGTPENENILLSFAEYGTACQLEQTCRLYRKQYGDPNADNEAASQQHDNRSLTSHWDADGYLIIRASLTPEQGALVLKAIETAVNIMNQDEIPVQQEQELLDDIARKYYADTTRPNYDHSVSAETQFNEINQAIRIRENRSADALVMMAESLLQHQTTNSNTADRFQVVVHIDHDTLTRQIRPEIAAGPDCYIESQAAIPVETARRISCCSKLVAAVCDGGEVLNIGRSTRAVPPAIQRALRIRDGICQFPGCSCSRHLDAHHIEHWADGGETSLDNLTHLCHHHHKLMHEGGFNVARRDGKLLFFYPDGSELSQIPLILKSSEDLPDLNTDVWRWCGDRMDYAIALHALSYADGNRELVL